MLYETILLLGLCLGKEIWLNVPYSFQTGVLYKT